MFNNSLTGRLAGFCLSLLALVGFSGSMVGCETQAQTGAAVGAGAGAGGGALLGEAVADEPGIGAAVGAAAGGLGGYFYGQEQDRRAQQRVYEPVDYDAAEAERTRYYGPQPEYEPVDYEPDYYYDDVRPRYY